MLRVFLISLIVSVASAQVRDTIRAGSKTMTESVILGEMAIGLAKARGFKGEHRAELGGTQIAWKALLAGEIDTYAEYTGTLRKDILHDEALSTDGELRARLKTLGIGMTDPLGFENTYAIGVKSQLAKKLGLQTIADLARFPDLSLGFSQEFLDRPEGWKSLRVKYQLPHTKIHSVEHELGYPAMASGTLEVMDLYSTDAEIAAYDLVALRDELHHFPSYQAVFVYRQDLEKTAPEFVTALKSMAGAINATAMIGMNRRAKLDGVSESKVAAEFLSTKFAAVSAVADESWQANVWSRLKEHMLLVSISLFAGIVVAIPLGVIASRYATLGHFILSLTGMIQTVPSLALLVFMIPLVGIGSKPAIIALFLYSLLPIVRNTYTGLRDISPSVHQSAAGLGLSSWSRLRLVELPMASRALLSGIKTSAVVTVGTATLGAIIGAGGLGQPILVGIRRDDLSLILQGAIPAALLAIAVQLFFDLLEKLVVPKGLRVSAD